MRRVTWEFAQQVCKSFPELTFDFIAKSPSSKERIDFSGPANAKVKLNFSSNAVEIDDVFVLGPLRGRGNTRRLTQALYLAAEELQFDKLRLVAAQEGRFAWLALGFTPTQDWWSQNLSGIKSRLADIEGQYPTDLIRLFEPFLTSRSPQLLPALANIPGGRPNALRPRDLAFKLLEAFSTWSGELEINDELNRRYLFNERIPSGSGA
ncbi:hypothetical protein [Rhizobium redzepovicii]|uniref:hypothetical protein n=1 Tax=Rhizobium redzepovicii TaxID=2867518 RepID=UPI0028725F16|nr:hypothetical protein [Rhizobium redzepovicii]MDR9782136.1 hypothetical protein [Rhizobium redzepovicii]